jgi:uncharacterized protein YegL
LDDGTPSAAVPEPEGVGAEPPATVAPDVVDAATPAPSATPQPVAPNAGDEGTPVSAQGTDDVQGTEISLRANKYEMVIRQTRVDLPSLSTWLAVFDQEGKRVSGLGSDDVLVNFGNSSESPEVSQLGLLGEHTDIAAYVLMIDRSLSMKNEPFAAAKAASASLVDGLGASDRMAIVSFGDEYRLEADFTSDKEKLKGALNAMVASDQKTRLYDSLNSVLEKIEIVGRDSSFPLKIAVLLISDGDDDGSSIGLEDLRKRIASVRVPIFSVGYSSSKITTLEQLATLSRGRYVTEKNPATIAALFSEFAEALGNEFFVQVQCAACAADRSKRELNLEVSKPGAVGSASAAVFMIQSEVTATRIADESAAQAASETQREEERKKKTLLIGVLVFGFLLAAVVIYLLLRKKAAPDNATAEIPVDAEPRFGETVNYNQGLDPSVQFIRLVKTNGEGVMDPEGPYGILSTGLVIGRSGEIRILGDDKVSAEHSRIFLAGDFVLIEDLGSTNGTIRNGAKVGGRERLEAGDDLEFGRTSFRVEFES